MSGTHVREYSLACGRQVRQQVGGIRRAKAGHRIPARGGRVTRNRGVELVVAGRDVVEVRGILRGIVGDAVERWVDEPDITAFDLVGHRHQTGPLWSAATGATHDEPATLTCVVDEHSGP